MKNIIIASLVYIASFGLIACGAPTDPAVEKIQSHNRAMEQWDRDQEEQFKKRQAERALENSRLAVELGVLMSSLKSEPLKGDQPGKIEFITGKSAGNFKNDRRLSMLAIPGFNEDGFMADLKESNLPSVEFDETNKPRFKSFHRKYLYAEGCHESFVNKMAEERKLIVTDNLDEHGEDIDTYILCGAINSNTTKIAKLFAREIILKDCELTYENKTIYLYTDRLTLIGHNLLVTRSKFYAAGNIIVNAFEKVFFAKNATLSFYSKGGNAMTYRNPSSPEPQQVNAEEVGTVEN